MYEKFFFLKEKPFHITPDPKFLYLSRKHGEAIDLMTFGIAEKKGFILLTGEVGTGKTTICRTILERLPKKTGSALILNPVLTDHELLKTITADLGLKAASDSVKDHLDCLNQYLLNAASNGGGAVVIIDEAQNLSTSTLEMVRLLSNLETEKEKLLQIILAGQPELNEKLRLPELRQLNQRIIIRYHLNPLDCRETDGYIKNRLTIAGGDGCVKFPDGAARVVFEKSGGIPRMINIICDRALTAAFIEEKRSIDENVVMKAVNELEREGCLHGYAPPEGGPAYAHYIPHIAISTFVAGTIAGFLWGPQVLR